MEIVQHGKRDTVGPQGVTAHELIEGFQVTPLTAPDQLLVRRRLTGPWPGSRVL